MQSLERRRNVALFVALVATALALGAALAHALELSSKIRLSQGDYFIVQQIYAGWDRLAYLLLVEFAGMIATVLLFRSEPRVFGAALAAVSQAGPLDLVLPTLPHVESLVRAATANWPVQPRIVVGEAEKQAAFRTARAALAASGTVTLELALAGVPHVAAYRLGWLEAQIGRRVLKGTTVILPNLVLGENVVPEFLQEYCTVPAVTAALAAVLADGPARARQEAAFARLDAIFGIGAEPPSRRAADVVLRLARHGRTAALPAPDHA